MINNLKIKILKQRIKKILNELADIRCEIREIERRK